MSKSPSGTSSTDLVCTVPAKRPSFSSTTKAAESIERSRRAIDKACRGENPTAGGFKWKFSNPNDQCDLTDSKI